MSKLQRLRILVTGGKGNLGSWIVRDLRASGHEVWTLSRNAIDSDEFHLPIDLTNAEQCSSLSEHNFERVIHTASVNNGSAPNFSYNALHINAFGTNNLLAALNPSSLKHFIYVSTFHVYGAGENEIDERLTPAPRNDYGLSHLFGEQYVRKFHATNSIPFTIIRLTNSYGCPTTSDTPQWSLLFNDLSRMAVQQKKLVLRSTGEARRDFVWMGDVCDVMSQLITQPAPNDVFNLSSGKSLKLIEMAEEIQTAYREMYGQDLVIEKKPPDGVSVQELVVNNRKLAELVEFKPKNMFQQEAVRIFKMLAAN